MKFKNYLDHLFIGIYLILFAIPVITINIQSIGTFDLAVIIYLIILIVSIILGILSISLKKKFLNYISIPLIIGVSLFYIFAVGVMNSLGAFKDPIFDLFLISFLYTVFFLVYLIVTMVKRNNNKKEGITCEK